MAQPKDKTELVRLAWIAALRTQGARKCEGSYYEDEDRYPVAKVCAMGLLAEVAGIHPRDMEDMHECDIGGHAGLSPGQSSDVVVMNDGFADGAPFPELRKHTFSEIATVVEDWFAGDKRG